MIKEQDIKMKEGTPIASLQKKPKNHKTKKTANPAAPSVNYP